MLHTLLHFVSINSWFYVCSLGEKGNLAFSYLFFKVLLRGNSGEIIMCIKVCIHIYYTIDTDVHYIDTKEINIYEICEVAVNFFIYKNRWGLHRFYLIHIF